MRFRSYLTAMTVICVSWAGVDAGWIGPLSAVGGRYCLGGLLVSGRAAREIPRLAEAGAVENPPNPGSNTEIEAWRAQFSFPIPQSVQSPR